MSDINDQFVQELRQTHVAIKLTKKWMGTTKALSKEQKAEAASKFDADPKSLKGSRVFIPTDHEAWKAIGKIKRQADEFFKDQTLDFPVKQVRLLKRGRLEQFSDRMCGFVAQLDQSVAHLQDVYGEMIEERRRSMQRLFNPDDYPPSLEGEFGITWEPVTLEPPDYLRDIAPRLYEQQKQLVQSRLAQAVDDAEDAFMGEFGKLLGRLQERLTGDADGQAKRFAPSTLNKILEFFDHFRDVSLRSNADFDALVGRAQNVCRGVTYDDLQTNGHVRDIVRDSMGSITDDLDALMEARPKRLISWEE